MARVVFIRYFPGSLKGFKVFLNTNILWEILERKNSFIDNFRSVHLSLVFDYLYTGAMYLTADDLTGVLRVIEALQMKCGVSVSKMVKQQKKRKTTLRRMKREAVWVEEAEFRGLEHLRIKEEGELGDDEMSSDHEAGDLLPVAAAVQDDQVNEPNDAEYIEVKPKTILDPQTTSEPGACFLLNCGSDFRDFLHCKDYIVKKCKSISVAAVHTFILPL